MQGEHCPRTKEKISVILFDTILHEVNKTKLSTRSSMGFFTKGNSGGLLDDRRKDVKTFKKIVKIATLGIVDTTGSKKNSSALSKKKK